MMQPGENGKNAKCKRKGAICTSKCSHAVIKLSLKFITKEEETNIIKDSKICTDYWFFNSLSKDKLV